MTTWDDKRWERIRQKLEAEASGREFHPKLASKRTLFGIPSDIETQMRQISEETTSRMQRRSETGKGDTDIGTDV